MNPITLLRGASVLVAAVGGWAWGLAVVRLEERLEEKLIARGATLDAVRYVPADEMSSPDADEMADRLEAIEEELDRDAP